ncbi:arginine decarboxylase [Flavobacteriaceae bacterium]|nr:arginine decarboxylase [Flavobacteriaceae bacterium]
MKNKYLDFIEQSFDFPQPEFKLNQNHSIVWEGVDIESLLTEHGTPLKVTYLPKISEKIKHAKALFQKTISALNYEGAYNYCYCTKSAHFSHILDEALKNDIHIETSSAFDIEIVKKLKAQGKITQNTFVICNGFKRDQYIENIAELINSGDYNCIPIIDNYDEIQLLDGQINRPFQIGIRIASEEEPKFEFYTSRLGIGYKNIVPFYKREIKTNPKLELKMLHFFINTGIKDNSYYWNELQKCLNVYVELKKNCHSLTDLNIGGGFPTKDSLGFDFDYEYMIFEIINLIQTVCNEGGVPVPNIFTEFGSYTVGESGAIFYEVLYQKQQNDREKWNMINSSFITTLPDSWAINKRFMMLPINHWNQPYERVLLGGLTCDSDDYYNNEQHVNAIYLPVFPQKKPLYIGFFNTGAYQESLGGFGGLQHCLIPQPKHILIHKTETGELETNIFAEQQSADNFMKLLGYD